LADLIELTFDSEGEDELWKHGLMLADVLDVLDTGEFRTFRDKVTGRRLMIGPDRAGRLLTVVVEPADRPGVCRVITGWPSSPAERTPLARTNPQCRKSP